MKLEETWESLSTVDREPEWFKDAKFGIYFHWGVYSVPAYGSEWYPRWMYTPGRKDWGGDIFEYNKKTFGPVSRFNYHDFIPMFTAEHFDAKEWAELCSLKRINVPSCAMANVATTSKKTRIVSLLNVMTLRVYFVVICFSILSLNFMVVDRL